MPALRGAVEWLNSKPLDAQDLRGKVVLVDFWTFTCINWRRTLPYLLAWQAKYRQSGLVIIGIHTPEFSFEHDVPSVQRQARAMKIDYPIAIDNNYSIWQAFDNQYWPALYLIDAQGHIRHQQFGEGEYDRCEVWLQQLLHEAGQPVDAGHVTPTIEGTELPADLPNLRSPETYVGYEQARNFASHGGRRSDARRGYTAPVTLKLNEWALVGDWTIQREAAVLNVGGGRVAFQFHARDLNLILAPGSSSNPVHFRVLIDGNEPAGSQGVDVDERGAGLVSEARMYQLIRQHGVIAERRFEIEFLDAGVGVYDFTFG
jgi:thiol-disulfide isomerase/thioredoxin